MARSGVPLLVLAALVAGPLASSRAETESPLLANWEAPQESATAVVSLPTGRLSFVGIVPCRMTDTRDGTFPPGYGPPALGAGSFRNFVLTGRCGIPASALAVSANLTAVNPPGPGFLLIRPTDGPSVVVSTLNFIPNQTTANGAVIPLGTAGGATFLAGVTGTELVIDVNGYYVEGGSVPTDTGFRHVTAGAEDAAAKLVANADVDGAAGIAESKLALSFPTHSNANDPTAGQKAALAGTSGIPGDTNRYLTNVDPRNTNARPPTVHGDSLHDATVASLDGTGRVPVAELGMGAATAAVFLRGDRTWAPPLLSGYFQSGSLNVLSVNVTSAFTKLGDFVTFTKASALSRVEVTLNSRAGAGTFAVGVNGVVYEVRIDGNPPTFGNQAGITTSNAVEQISIFAAFEGLTAGSHTVSVWARTLPGISGSSTGVLLDPGGWGGRIVVKETY